MDERTDSAPSLRPSGSLTMSSEEACEDAAADEQLVEAIPQYAHPQYCTLLLLPTPRLLLLLPARTLLPSLLLLLLRSPLRLLPVALYPKFDMCASLIMHRVPQYCSLCLSARPISGPIGIDTFVRGIIGSVSVVNPL